ncbi:hypothetical protein CgunFtcFv8_001808 [Champsocephalus gunnari]|uniref:Peptidase S1 domain-containing protein n=1 Tax=Champsocephalus gunnari TaxID=52237 RepID=A0AAN8CRI0_CHAGU|nr:hypothetical protein CgunFtcFv8_001808 [Champsocephalus gunnari]
MELLHVQLRNQEKQDGSLDDVDAPDVCSPHWARLKGAGLWSSTPEHEGSWWWKCHSRVMALAAAHCIISDIPSSYTLYFGRETQSGPNVHEVERTLSQIIVHPDYNNTLFNNDIALMKLSSAVSFNDYIRPVCLASNSSQFHNSTSCWGTGWGRLGKDEDLPSAYSLQEVQVPVIGGKQCGCIYRSEINITNEMICAGQENKGTCQGDSVLLQHTVAP